MDVLTFPSSRVFAFRLPLSQKLAGLGIAINDLSVFLVLVCHMAFSCVGLAPTWPSGEWEVSGCGVFTATARDAYLSPVRDKELRELFY